MTRRGSDGAVVAFFALACAVSWAWWIPLASTQPDVRPGDGWPTHLPGLAGPLVAAFLVAAWTEGRTGVRALARSMARLPRGRRPLLMTAAPLAALLVVLPVAALVGDAPSAEDFALLSGTGATAVAVAFALLLNGFGEETGWRGFAQARLEPRHGYLRATLAVTAAWAIWHVPLFFLLDSFRGFGPLTAIGWLVGLAAGAFVLASVLDGTGGSVLAVAFWHATYNLGAATEAGDGLVGPVLTAGVIFWAVSLVQRERARTTSGSRGSGRGRRSARAARPQRAAS